MRWIAGCLVCIAAGCLSVPAAGETESSDGTGSSGATSSTSVTTSTTTTDASSSDATSTSATTTTVGSTGEGSTGGGSSALEIDGEIVDVPDGWDGGVWFDFSESYTFDANAYFDDPYTFNNAPQSMFVLRAPFEPGLGVVTVHTVLELTAPSGFEEHYFFQATGATGPDALNQVVDCRGLAGVSGVYCIGAGSQGDGDGVFTIDANWNMQLFDPINNTNNVGFDPQGIFSGSGEPTLYYGTPTGLYEYPSTQILTDPAQPRSVTKDGHLAAIIGERAVQRLVTVEPVSNAVTVLRSEPLPAEPIARQNAGALRIVTGDTSVLPGTLYALVQSTQLWVFLMDGPEAMVASSNPAQGWRWASAVIPESSHPLARDGRPTFYILEANRDLDIDRVIWLQPPGPP